MPAGPAGLPPRTARMWAQAVRPFSFTASIVPVLLGSAIASAQGMFTPGLLGAFGAYFYSGRPIAYKYHALGDLAIFLLFGPLMALGAYYVQARVVELVPMLYALPVGCLVTAILHVNNIRDSPFDGRGG